MSKAGHKPPPGQSRQLAEFMKETISEQGISLRTAAKHIGIDIASLCRILNGDTTPNAGVCNLIADYFDIPRVQVYEMAGWLEMDHATDLNAIRALIPLFPEPRDQADIEQIFANIGDPTAREKFIQILQRLKSETQKETSGL